MGSAFYYITTLLILMLITVFATALNKKWVQSIFLYKLTNITQKIVCPALFIRMFIEMHYDLQINAVIQLKIVTETQTFCDWLSTILAVSGQILSFILPSVFLCKIYKLKKTKFLNEKIAKHKYGELYKDLVRGD